MTEILGYIKVGIGVLALFGAAVFVHEFGHFWVARRRGLKVLAFAVGFGPKIYGWTRAGIEYSIRWIPAGGFVKLPQMVTSEALEGAPEAGAEPLPPVAPFSKILVAVAGPFMNIVFAFFIATIIYFAGLPVLVNPSIIGYVEPGSDEAKMGIKEGSKIVAVDGKPVDSWQEVQMNAVLARTNVIPVVIEQEGQRINYQLKATVNPDFGLKMFHLDPKDHPEVMEVFEGGPGEKAGLKPNDIVNSFGGVPIAGREQLIGLIQERGGKETEMVVERNGEKVSLHVTPNIEQTDPTDPSKSIGRIEVALGSNATNVYRVQRPGPSPWSQVRDVFSKTIGTLSALLHPKETGVGVKDLSGPPGILAMLATQLKTDFRLALSFLVLLNINLAIINLLPVPVLDGGHILMALIERVRGRPLSARFLEYITQAFAVLLISFMLFVSYYDLRKRLPLFKSMFQSESRIEESQTK